MRSDLAALLRDRLLPQRNGDGGWGYYPGKTSRLEPTCWALLSLAPDQRPEDAPLVEAGLSLLAKWQRADGLIAEPQLPPNLAFNGLASVVMTALRASPRTSPPSDDIQRRLLTAIVGVKSKTAWNWRSPVRQDNSLVGWPWTEEGFGWVEPTAWCMLALKRAGPGIRAPGTQSRIEEAERLLFDRQCPDGGWNYGNSEVLGQQLHAFVPPTALALLALHDRRERSEVRRALDFLRGAWRHEPAGMALGLSLLCVRAYGLPANEIEAALTAAFEKCEFLGNHAVVGMVRYALTAGTHGPTVLTV
ncbi:MAG: hypothetical protein NTV05_09890 [Acidobacteria bacterium]|nr:hypothetical protein [Acidobacteriota bacterium]